MDSVLIYVSVGSICGDHRSHHWRLARGQEEILRDRREQFLSAIAKGRMRTGALTFQHKLVKLDFIEHLAFRRVAKS